MGTNTRRKERIAEAYHKEISNILTYNIRDPRLDGVSITNVLFTPDLRLAKVYYDIPRDDCFVEDVEEGFKKSKGYIKRELSHRVSTKYMPDLKFYFDESAEVKEKIDVLFDQIEKNNNGKDQED